MNPIYLYIIFFSSKIFRFSYERVIHRQPIRLNSILRLKSSELKFVRYYAQAAYKQCVLAYAANDTHIQRFAMHSLRYIVGEMCGNVEIVNKCLSLGVP